jgi:N-acetyl-alpha-D-muramate 1-phosphate uridylyltransferase
MILAAGLGTRLHPLTREIPKALIDVGGVPMLERVARRLIDAGADRIVVNVSSLADQIVTFLDDKTDWRVDIRVSLEPDGPLDTGGGLLQAAHLFRGDRPILIHNVDILTDIDLGVLYRDHESSSVATLAVRPARSDRYLLFDGEGMTGYAYGGKEYRARVANGAEARKDFLGIQVVSPRLLGRLEERQKFSIFTSYMRLIGEAEIVRGREVEVATWMDIGTHEQLDAARRTFEAAE